MRRSFLFLVLALLTGFATAGAAPKPDASAKTGRVRSAVDDGWPATRPGTLGWRWVRAFNTGADSMRALYREQLAASSLAERGLDDRIARYGDLRERLGSLTLSSVVKSDRDSVQVDLLDADLKSHRFTFVTEAKSPWKLVTVKLTQMMNVPHGGGFHH